ncbi:dTDP-4-dehydrorhamnose reductase [Amaricoccus macauensis]|uniref:dTDP-4-dehydrorhamnose reductase n=1 Tax=Amaricoccus macauensis TaxID=57001 RepID=UPI003C7AD3A8
MKALVFGKTGQVARELAHLAPEMDIEAECLGREQADLTNLTALTEAIEATDASIIVNAAAYTAVDQAEDEPELAHKVNALAPEAMAKAAAARGLPFLHISTDYVFEGAPGDPKTEIDPTGPTTEYGRSKLAGEKAVATSGADAVILRTAWVFSVHGKNFLKTMLNVGKGRDEMRVVGDQHGQPTAARDIARALWTIAGAYEVGRGQPGTFHFASQPATTWAGFASAIFERAGWAPGETPKVTAIETHEWPTKAARPADSVLDCSAIMAAYGIDQPDWHASLDEAIRELT